jgi:hypothetical protein
VFFRCAENLSSSLTEQLYKNPKVDETGPVGCAVVTENVRQKGFGECSTGALDLHVGRAYVIVTGTSHNDAIRNQPAQLAAEGLCPRYFQILPGK